MFRHGYAAGVVALSLSACGLPPHYQPKSDERFWGLMALEKWTKDQATPGATSRNWKTFAMTALVTWRIGREAPLPRMWTEGPCTVTEGTWADTPWSPPAHGTITLTGRTDTPVELYPFRTTWGVKDLEGDAVWPDGRELTVEASGGDLGTFSFTSTVKPPPEVLSHDLAGLRPEELHVPRTEPVTVRWVPQPDEVNVTFVQADAAQYEFFHTIWCHFPGMDGTGTVPAAALGSFVDKQKTYLTNMYVGTVVRQSAPTAQVDYELWQWNGRAVRVAAD